LDRLGDRERKYGAGDESWCPGKEGGKVIVNMTSKIIYFMCKVYLNVNYPKLFFSGIFSSTV